MMVLLVLMSYIEFLGGDDWIGQGGGRSFRCLFVVVIFSKYASLSTG